MATSLEEKKKEFLSKKERHPKGYEVLMDTFTGTQNIVSIKCITHNHVFEQYVGNFIKGHLGCEYCRLEKLREDFKKKIIPYQDRFEFYPEEYTGNNTYIRITCKEHNETFSQLSRGFFSGDCICSGCQKKRLTDIFLKNTAKAWGVGLWEYDLTTYKTASEKMSIKCVGHNHWFEQAPTSHINGYYACKYCQEENDKKEYEKNLEVFKNNIKPFEHRIHFYMGTFKNTKDAMQLKCLIHANIYEQSPSSFLQGHDGCSFCIDQKLKDAFIEKAKNAGFQGKYFYCIDEYTLNNKPISICCINHKQVFGTNPYDHLSRGAGCEECKSDKVKEEFIKNSIKIHKGVYTPIMNTYVRSNKKVDIWCTIHKKIYKKTPHGHIQGRICPDCAKEKLLGFINYTTIERIKFDYKSMKGMCYIIQCWNNEEEFYKIGITNRNTKARFAGKDSIPYNYEVIYEHKSNFYNSFYIEQYLHKVFTDKQYIPKIYFAGKNECFSELPLTLDEIKDIIKQVESSIENNTHRDHLQKEENN